MIELTRTCRLADFPGCATAAVWQQALVADAYTRWSGTAVGAAGEGDGSGRVICLNWGHSRFTAPGVQPIYRTDAYTTLRAGESLAVLIALSVLDRIEAPVRFLHHHSQQLIAGGLIICTFACWDAEGPDCAGGAELRRRIYDERAWQRLITEAGKLGLHLYGGFDRRYHGHTVGDHTIASLVLTKGIL